MPTRKYVYAGDNVLQEKDGAGVTQTNYTWSGDGYGDLLSQDDGTTTKYYEPDGLGSTDALADDAQAVTDRWAYRAFGQATQTAGTTATPFTWVGRHGYFADTQTGLYLLGSGTRHYDPATAQFLSRDPIAFVGGDTNLYRYVQNSPAVYVDPVGLQAGFGGAFGPPGAGYYQQPKPPLVPGWHSDPGWMRPGFPMSPPPPGWVPGPGSPGYTPPGVPPVPGWGIGGPFPPPSGPTDAFKKECCDKAKNAVPPLFISTGSEQDWGLPICCFGVAVPCIKEDALFKSFMFGKVRPDSGRAAELMIKCAEVHEKVHIDLHTRPCPPKVDLQIKVGLTDNNEDECQAYKQQIEECLLKLWRTYCQQEVTPALRRMCRSEVQTHLFQMTAAANRYGCNRKIPDLPQWEE